MNESALPVGTARSSPERHAGASVAASPCREIPTGKIQKNGLRGQHAAHYDAG
jgi:hypothetical protein